MARDALIGTQELINNKIEKVIQHYRLDMSNKADLMYWDAKTTYFMGFGGKAVSVAGGKTYHIPSGVYKIMQGIKAWKTMCPPEGYNENSLGYFVEKLRELLREASLSNSWFRREETKTLYNTQKDSLEIIANSTSIANSAGPS